MNNSFIFKTKARPLVCIASPSCSVSSPDPELESLSESEPEPLLEELELDFSSFFGDVLSFVSVGADCLCGVADVFSLLGVPPF